jgi:hypothetical protein
MVTHVQSMESVSRESQSLMVLPVGTRAMNVMWRTVAATESVLQTFSWPQELHVVTLPILHATTLIHVMALENVCPTWSQREWFAVRKKQIVCMLISAAVVVAALSVDPSPRALHAAILQCRFATALILVMVMGHA